jgi:hypothetical protein
MAKITYKPTGIFVDDAFLPLADIQKECTKTFLKEMKSKDLHLLTIEWKMRNMGNIRERIVLPFKNIEIIKKLIVGRTINFGEINGKHSEVYGDLDENHLTLTKKKKDLLEFLLECPDGHDYNYSFLHTFMDYANDGGYNEGTWKKPELDDITEAQLEEFRKAINDNL